MKNHHRLPLQRTLLRLGAALVCLSGLSACLESEQPPCPEGSYVDESVTGRWLLDGQSTGELAVFRESESRFMAFLSGHGLGLPARIDAGHFDVLFCQGKTSHYGALRIPSTNQEGKKLVYFPFRYETQGEQLKVWLPSFEAYTKGIEQGRLKGKTWSTTWGSNVSLTSGSAELGTWIDALDSGSFDQARTYHRPRK